MNDAESKKRIFAEAQRLNKEGYGLYFAPCLRREKRGNAESAAYISALWVDVDGKDERSLRKLNDFEQAPSAVVDSGGGYHAYWFLSDPLCLETDEQKAYIASIMIGLFSVTGGDEAYVKSVASVMRLPDSINTKPDRDGAKVTVSLWNPERRYKLSEFEWLSKPKEETIDGLKVVTLNGHGILPPRTEQYLISGASKNSRNTELFAAACQMRDAGYSQSDAERELIARHVADAVGGESANQREKEARATIESAYSQPARDPIVTAKERVSALVSRYPVEQKADRPTAAQIAEVVEACVHLNAVEWAEERQRIKALCGDGLKISDIDRLYREKRKAAERQQQTALVDTEEYIAMDEYMIYRKHSYRGTMQKIIAAWGARILERVNRMDDDGQMERVARVELQSAGRTETLEIPSELFGDPNALTRFLAANAGETFTTRAGMSSHLTPAILALSGDYPTRQIYRFMGWTQIDGRWTYITPADSITTGGKLADPPEVELSARLGDYGIRAHNWDDSKAAFDAMMRVFPPNIAPTCIAFAMLPLLQRFFKSAAMRPALHLAGTYGSGKSELAALMASFYGNFSRDAPPSQWGDTINTVEVLGYPLTDALYWVDDYKHIYADEKTYTRFMQSYSRNMGRGRLTREAKLRHEKPCRGLILSTGETTIEGEASLLSRMLVINVPPWEHRDPNGEHLAHADALREHLPGFTAHFASWIARQLEAGTLEEEVISRYEQNVIGYRAQLRAQLKGSRASTGRLIGNWAVLVTVYQLLTRFVAETDRDYLLPAWQDSIIETVATVREERAS
ncbi:MAG: hypothetical protein EA396_00205, partial [Anaerolineaceae bacterium]